MTKLFTVSTLLWLYIALLHSTFRLLVLPSPVVIRNGGSGLAPSDTLTHLARFRNRNKQSGEIDHLTMWYCSNRNGRVKMGLLAGRVIILLISRLKAIIDSEYSIYSVAHQSGHVFCVYGRTVGVHGIVGSGKIVERGFGTTFQNCACWLWSYRMRWAVWMVPAECTRFFSHSSNMVPQSGWLVFMLGDCKIDGWRKNWSASLSQQKGDLLLGASFFKKLVCFDDRYSKPTSWNDKVLQSLIGIVKSNA